MSTDFCNSFVDDYDCRSDANFPTVRTMQLIYCPVGHQEHDVSVRLNSSLEAPRTGNRIVVTVDPRSLLQLAFATCPAEHEASFDDIGENQDGLGISRKSFDGWMSFI